MSNSSLVNYKKISPNKTVMTNKKIDTITIHCMAGQCSVETCGEIFANPSRQASSNYGIGPDGRVGMYVEEKDRAWTSSNRANDSRAVTIEVASDKNAPYAVKPAAYETLIKLVADICKRNKIKKLLWKNDKSLIGKVDKQNMTLHRWFSDTACPGKYLVDKHPDIVSQVNKLLGADDDDNKKKDPYEVGKAYTLQVELNVRKGPGTKYGKLKYSDLSSADKKKDKDKDGALDKGSRVKCKAVKKSGKDYWIQCSSGWLAAQYNGKTYIK